jgi:hypothetical protein
MIRAVVGRNAEKRISTQNKMKIINFEGAVLFGKISQGEAELNY